MKNPVGRLFIAIGPNGMIHGIDEENNVFVQKIDQETLQGSWMTQETFIRELREARAKAEQDQKVKSMLLPGPIRKLQS